MHKQAEEQDKIKSDERTKEAQKRENDNLKSAVIECKDKIEEYKRALDETEGRLERMKRERGREGDAIKAVRAEETNENFMLEERLYKLEDQLENEMKGRETLAKKLELNEKMIKTYEIDKEQLEDYIRKIEKEKEVLKQTQIREERAKTEVLSVQDEKERQIFKLEGIMENQKEDITYKMSSLDKLQEDFKNVEEKLRIEITKNSEFEKEVLIREREIERTTEDLQRCVKEKYLLEENIVNFKRENKELVEVKETGGQRGFRLERQLEASQKDIEYQKRETRLGEEKIEQGKEELQKNMMRLKAVEGENRVKQEKIDEINRLSHKWECDYKKLESDHEKLRQVNDQREEELGRLKGVQSRVEMMRERVKTIEKEQEEKVAELERFKRDNGNWVVKEKEFKSNIEKLTNCLAEQTSSVKNYEDRNKHQKIYEVECEELKNRINGYQKEEAILKSQVDRSRIRAEEVNRDLSEVVKFKDEFSIKNRELQLSLNEKECLISNQQEEVNSYRCEVQTLKGMGKDKHGLFVSLGEKLHMTELKVEEFKDVLRREESKYKKLESEFFRLKDELKKAELEKSVSIESVDKMKLQVYISFLKNC